MAPLCLSFALRWVFDIALLRGGFAIPPACLFGSLPKPWAYLRLALVLVLLLIVLLVLPAVLVLLLVVLLVLPVVLVLLILVVVLVLIVVLVEVHGEIPPEFICGFPAGVVYPVPAVSFQPSFCLLGGK